MPAYAAAKAGVLSLTKSLALELARHRIRVNAICPGLVWTRSWEILAAQLKASAPAYAALEPRGVFLDHVRRTVPLGEEQSAEDVGALAVFLASHAARHVTGQWISVDGGITLRGGQ
jgi:NAD(P)-dependent dehydrogenase (short-subunit alcohol dehydrogenase family)